MPNMKFQLSIRRNRFVVAAALLAGVAWGREGDLKPVVSPDMAVRLSVEEAAKGRPCRFQGVVIHASALRPRTWVVSGEDVLRGGIVVHGEGDGCFGPFEVGDVVFVDGVTKVEGTFPAVSARHIEKRGTLSINTDIYRKYYDFRKGYLHGRTMRLKGTVRDVSHSDGVSVITLRVDRQLARLIVPGRVNAKSSIGRQVRAVGCVFNRYSSDGAFMEGVLELEGSENLMFLDPDPIPDWVLPIVGALAAVLGLWCFALVIRAKRERHAQAAVAAERRRMAADLHDTIEQHLAGARMLLTGALSVPGIPPQVVRAMEAAGGILANAKIQTRDAVLNLRADESLEKSPDDAMREIAYGIEKTGAAKVRTNLGSLPERLPSGVFQDIVAIVREATTNAIKHGKAKTIAIVADGKEDGFILRVLNDGEKFDASAALGPETGHFGLSGMRERALRSHLDLSFVSDDKWCGVRIGMRDFSRKERKDRKEKRSGR